MADQKKMAAMRFRLKLILLVLSSPSWWPSCLGSSDWNDIVVVGGILG